METYRSDRTFDLKHFLVFLIRRWYWIVGVVAFGMVATPAVQFLRLIRTYRKNLAAFESGAKDAVEPTFPSFPFAYVLIGAVLGLVLASMVIWLLYYLNNRLKCASELNKPKDAELLACYRTGKDTKIEAFAKKLVRYPKTVSEERMTSLLCARLAAACKNQELRTLVIAGNIGYGEKTILLAAIDTLRKVGITVDWIGNVLTEPEAILGMKAGVGVILAEQIGKATYNMIDEELAVCLRNRTRLLGFVLFE